MMGVMSEEDGRRRGEMAGAVIEQGPNGEVFLRVGISTAAICANRDSKISGAQEDKALVITIDTREQNVHQRLGLGTKTKITWGETNRFEAQELSGLAWPIRYRVITQEGFYLRGEERVHFTTAAEGIDSRRKASDVLMRAAVLLVIVAGVGVRRAQWLLEQLFHVEVSKSALHRWVGEIASQLPQPDEMIRLLHERQPIQEGHLDELFPRGTDACVLVLKDEYGRILTLQEVEARDEKTVVPFLERIKRLGIVPRAFYIDGWKPYFNAIRTVFGQTVAIQYDYFHIVQNVWRHLGKWAVANRRDIKSRSQEVSTPWYKAKLEALAKSLWENRYLLFKAEHRMSDDERQRLAEIVQADDKVGCLRSFLCGVWNIFENSTDEIEARAALAKLKRLPIDPNNPDPFHTALEFLQTNFEWMTAFLRDPAVRRNSLAESGMRVLRRLELEHDGFRSAKGLSDCLRIYQAIRYLGWSAHNPHWQPRSPSPSG